ncbi:MAG: DUF3102 domain-containing protein [Phycisphaerae bacterium]
MTKALTTENLTDMAEQINAAHREVETTMRAGLQHALEAGILLLEAKALHKHGGWLKWVDENCECGRRLAQKYMQIAREVPKLQGSNAARVAHLSFHSALHLVAGDAKRLAKMDDGKQDRLLTTAENLPVSVSCIVKAEYQQKGEDSRARIEAWYAEAEANMLAAEYPGTWAWEHREELEAELRKEPRFVEMQAEIDRLDQERQDAEARAYAAMKRQEEADRGLRDSLRTEAANRYGHAVEPGTVSICPREPETHVMHARFATHVGPERYAEALEADGDLLTKDDAVSRAAGLCAFCHVDLTPENAGVPNKPGFVFGVCRWCDEHRGATHCVDCGAPLPEDARQGCAGFRLCQACRDKDAAQEAAPLPAQEHSP